MFCKIDKQPCYEFALKSLNKAGYTYLGTVFRHSTFVSGDGSPLDMYRKGLSIKYVWNMDKMGSARIYTTTIGANFRAPYTDGVNRLIFGTQ